MLACHGEGDIRGECKPTVVAVCMSREGKFLGPGGPALKESVMSSHELSRMTAGVLVWESGLRLWSHFRDCVLAWSGAFVHTRIQI